MLNLLLALLISASLILPQTVRAQDALQLEEFACLASNPETFQNCLNDVSKTGVPLIKITQSIICTSPGSCSFKLQNSGQTFTISSSSAENKFIRQNDFSYTLLTFENSANITLRGLSFEDQGTTGCPQATVCPPLVSAKNTLNLTFDNLNFFKTRGPSLQVLNSRSVTVSNSHFRNSFKTGLEVINQKATDSIRIEGNTFENNAGTALIYQVPSVTPSSVSANKFINNHSQGAYSNCAFPCTGAQVKILTSSANLNFGKNTIAGGPDTFFDSIGLYASGIEVSGQNIYNANLYCNEISGNRGSGIVQSGPFRNITNISVTENKIFGNGLNMNIPTATTDTNNCYTRECQISCSK